MTEKLTRHLTRKNRECTQSPIFLLQTGEVVTNCETNLFEHVKYIDEDEWVELNPEDGRDGPDKLYEEKPDCPEDIEEWENCGKDPEKNYILNINEYILEMSYGDIKWTTHSGGVWFTREEAEEEATRRSYNYGRKGRNWRVYCVPAHGVLAEILHQHSTEDEK
jgi:hypothetical protein